jgi:parvulin-like peptidyl-prolyl isomerase
MAKRNATAPKETVAKQFTKKHLARAERERNQIRIILIVAIGLAAIVIGLVGYGLLQGYVIGPNIKVAQVNNTAIIMRDFQADAAMRRWDDLLKYQQYQQYISLYQSMGLQADTQLQTAVLNLQYEMSNKTFLGNAVLSKMVEDILIGEEAAKANITVSQAEVDQQIQEFLGYFANGTPTPTITTTPYITPTYSLTQLAMLATITPTIGATATATPTLVPTQSATATTNPGATAVTAEITPTPLPTSTPYTFEGYKNVLAQYQLTLGKTGLKPAQIEKYMYHRILRTKMFDSVTASIPNIADQVRVRDIVVGSQDDANKVITRLSNGENWDAITSEVSLDTNTKDYGGDLGWFPKGASAVSTEIETAAFEMTIGETRIVQVSSNWHVIQLVGKDSNRPIREDYLLSIKEAAFSQWLQKLKDAATIKTFNTWQNWVPVLPTLPPTTTTQ